MVSLTLIERVKVKEKVREGRPNFFVDLPTYSMVGNEVKSPAPSPGEPRGQRKLLFVDIEVPDDEAEEIGKSGKFRLVKDKIKIKYRGQKKWDNDDPLDI